MLSIGALARATSIPVETLRTWERRYGFPAPVNRKGSGHRRYPLDTVERLRFASRALALGHKPSVVMRASVSALRDLIALTDSSTAFEAGIPKTPLPSGTFVERCLDRISYLDGVGLTEELERASRGAPVIEFLLASVAPLIHALGDAWERGDFEVGHEHFASEHLREFLSDLWRPLSERSRGPIIVCATVGGERHVLGLHMAATALALGGAQIVFLGADMPPREVASAAVTRRARGIALSAATGTDEKALRRDVRALVAALGAPIPVAVGGAGFVSAPPGVLPLPDLQKLQAWAETL